MLRREHSEIQWFRERAASIHTNLHVEYPVDITPMTSTSSEPSGLNPEPADPQERAEQHLAPKSYADAAQEAVDVSSNQNGSAAEENKYQNSNGASSQHNNANGNKGHGNTQEVEDARLPRKSSRDTNVGKKLENNQIVFEKYSNGDGSTLTSVKPDPGYDESLRHNEEIALRSREPSQRRKSRKAQDIPKPQLQSGRRPGARWEQSAYVARFFLL